MNDSEAIVLAAVVPSLIGAVATVYVARLSRTVNTVQDRQEALGEKVTETHHQVTVNGHSSGAPTVLDRIEDVRRDVQSVREDLAAHERSAEDIENRIWSALWYAFRVAKKEELEDGN